MRAYSLDLRQRIVEARKSGLTQQQAAERFGVSVSTVQRYDQRQRRQESLSPKPIPGRQPVLSREQAGALAQMLQERQDWTLNQMAQAWQERTGRALPKSTLHDHLKRLGYRFKKRAATPKSVARKSGPPSRSRSNASPRSA